MKWRGGEETHHGGRGTVCGQPSQRWTGRRRFIHSVDITVLCMYKQVSCGGGGDDGCYCQCCRGRVEVGLLVLYCMYG